MSVYSGILIVLFVLWVLYKGKIVSQNKTNIIIGAVLIAVISLRNIVIVGVDMVRYEYYYQVVSNLTWTQTIRYCEGDSILYYFLSWICSNAGIAFPVFMACLSAGVIAVYSYYIGKHSDNIFLSYLVVLGTGVYTLAFSGIRQSVAIACVLLFLDTLKKKEYIKGIVIFIIGFFFHFTIIIILPFVVLKNLKVNKVMALVYAIIVVFAVLFGSLIGKQVTQLFFERYLGHYESTNRVGGMTLFCIAITLMYLLFAYKKIRTSNSEEQWMFNALVIMTLIQSASSYAYAFTRINMTYMVSFMSLVVPQITNKENIKFVFNEKSTYGISLGLKIIFIGLMIFNYFNQIEGESLSGYLFFWEQV